MKSLTAELTHEQEKAKSLFLLELKQLKKSKKQLSPEKQVAEYLKKVYEIDVPEDFSEDFCVAYSTFHSGEFNMSFDVVDAIVFACNLWKEYIANTVDYNHLICEQILNMVRIHAAVIATRDITKTGIQLRKQPSYGYSVQVTYDGLIVVYD